MAHSTSCCLSHSSTTLLPRSAQALTILGKLVPDMTFDPSALQDACARKATEQQASSAQGVRPYKRQRSSAFNVISGIGESSNLSMTSPTHELRQYLLDQTGPEDVCHGGPQDEQIHQLTKFMDPEAEDPVINYNLQEALLPELLDDYKDAALPDAAQTLNTMLLNVSSAAQEIRLQAMDLDHKGSKLEAFLAEAKSQVKQLAEEKATIEEHKILAQSEVKLIKADLDKAIKELQALKLEAKTQKDVIENFKSSEEFKKLQGDYAIGSYYYGLKQARAWIKAKIPELDTSELEAFPDAAQGLDISEFATPTVSECGAGDGEELGIEFDDTIDIDSLLDYC